MSEAFAILTDAAYNNRDIDTSIIEEVPSLLPSGSRNTNATGFVRALRLFVEAFTSGDVGPARAGPCRCAACSGV
jgi:hypothetical protein